MIFGILLYHIAFFFMLEETHNAIKLTDDRTLRMFLNLIGPSYSCHSQRAIVSCSPVLTFVNQDARIHGRQILSTYFTVLTIQLKDVGL